MPRRQLEDLRTNLQKQKDSKCQFDALVLSESQELTYSTKDGAERKYYRILVADQKDFTKIRVYREKDIKVGKTYRFQNMLKKDGADDFWCITTSSYFQIGQMSIGDTLVEEAKKSFEELTEEENKERKLNEALSCSTTSTVKAKIVQVTDIDLVKQGTLPIRFLLLKDEENQPAVKLALFNEDAKQSYQKNGVVSVTNVYSYKKNPRGNNLTTKKESRIEFITDETLKGLTFNDEDSDEDMLSSKVQLEDFSIIGIHNTKVYECCPNIGCHKKKITQKMCPICQQAPEKVSLNCYSSLAIERKSKIEKHTLFYFDLEKLFDLPELSSTIEGDDISDFIATQLPKASKALFEKNGMVLRPVKRKLNF